MVLKKLTPAVVKLKRKDSHIVAFEKEGYRPTAVSISSHGTPWVLMDLLWGVGVLIAAPIDLITGANYSLTPDAINVELENSNE